MKNIVVRSISGIVYVAIIVAAILLGWPFFFGLTAVLAMLGVMEFHRISSDSFSLVTIFLDSLGTIMIVLAPSIVLPDGAIWGTFFAFAVLGCLIVRYVITIFDDMQQAFPSLATSVFSVFYIGLPLALLNLLYILSADCKWVTLCVFIMIWLNDTGAFCFGSAFGRHKLCERLSPKKSWEGFWGGFLCCLAFGVAAYFIFGIFPLAPWIVLGALVSLFATLGDLLESLFKRTLHVKDSGNIIPGHGGILDRIDSLLLVAPVAFIFTFIALTW